MKKEKLILITGIFFLLFGVILFALSPEKKTVQSSEAIITEAEAKEIVKEKVGEILNLYENPKEVFNVEESDKKLYFVALNYDEVVNKKFTKKYKDEFEKAIINKNKVVIKEDDKTYILKPIEEIKYILDNSTINLEVFNNKEITGEIRFSNYKLNNNDELEYLIYIKTISLIKSGDSWLVDSFVY